MIMFKCNICNKEFKSKPALCGHMAYHKTSLKECPVCGRMIFATTFSVHLKSHEHDAACLECGKRIKGYQKFCSQSCSAKYNNRMNPKRRGTVKECPNCGKQFTTRFYNGKYCSKKCSSDAVFNEAHKRFLNGEFSDKSRERLRKHYIAEFGNKCAICGINEWQNRPLVLTLDHINGHSEDNRVENLRLLCPNCDSQTPTFKGRNKGNGREYRRKHS